jgi:hypothetical protein
MPTDGMRGEATRNTTRFSRSAESTGGGYFFSITAGAGSCSRAGAWEATSFISGLSAATDHQLIGVGFSILATRGRIDGEGRVRRKRIGASEAAD